MNQIESSSLEDKKPNANNKILKNSTPLKIPDIKVSVILPVYNVEKYLSQCLDSIINQTLKEIEIICVNDGSTDKSPLILEEYAKKDDRIIIINQENAGSGVARNLGIKHVKGEYIGFVDSDDYIDVNMFEKLYKNAKLNNTDIVMCPMCIISETGVTFTTEELKALKYYDLDCFSEDFDNKVFDHEETRDFIFSIAVNAYNKIYRTEFVNKINAKFAERMIFQDNIFFYQTYIHARRVSLIRDFLYFHRINRIGSAISNKGTGFYDIIEIHNMIKKIFEKLPNFDDYKTDLLNNKIIGIIFRYSQVSPDHKKEFFKLIKRDFRKIKLNDNDLDNLTKIANDHYFNIIKSNSYMEFDLRCEIRILSYKNNNLNNQNKKIANINNKLESTNKELKASFKELHLNNDHLKEEVNELKSDKVELGKVITQLNFDKDELRENISQLNLDKVELRENISQLNLDNDHLQIEVNELNRDNLAFLENISQLELDKKYLLGNVSELRWDLVKLLKNINKLNLEKNELLSVIQLNLDNLELQKSLSQLNLDKDDLLKKCGST